MRNKNFLQKRSNRALSNATLPTRTRVGVLTERLEPRQLFSTYTVNTTGDSPLEARGVLTLRQAVHDANVHPGADTINFSPTVFTAGSQHTITLLHDVISFTDTTGATTLTGPGAAVLSVSGQSAYRIFNVAAKTTVSISALTLDGGNPAQGASGINQGGAINNAGALTLSNLVVTASWALEGGGTGMGGGIYSSGSLDVSYSSFGADEAVGNILAAGGAIYATGKLTVSNSSFSQNFAGTGDGNPSGPAEGGAIYSAASAVLTNDTFTQNSVAGGISYNVGLSGGGAYGGAVYGGGSLTITSSTLSGNVATSGGNIAPDEPGLGGGSTGGVGVDMQVAAGGGVFGTGVTSILNSTLSGNSAIGGSDATGEKSGGIAEGGGVATTGTITINQSTLNGNTALGGPGNNHEESIQTTATVGGAAFGGGLWIGGTNSKATVVDSTVANNHAQGGEGNPADFSSSGLVLAGAGGLAEGGGIDIHGANASLSLSDSTISGNRAIAAFGGAGAISGPIGVQPGPKGQGIAGGIDMVSTSMLLANNSIISANLADSGTADAFTYINPASSHNLIGITESGPGTFINNVNGNQVGVTNPMLSPLGNFGGPTQTMMPQVGSLAIDRGSNAAIPAGVSTDQRGAARIFHGTVDIGAVEFSQVTISGYAFDDIAGNGIPQRTDPAPGVWQVYVDLNDTGVYVNGDPTARTNPTTGKYMFSFSPITVARPLIVRETKQTNWRQTEPAAPLGYYLINPANGNAANINFGNSATSLVAGTVYHDSNANGRFDRGETGLAGWTVEVDQLIGGVWRLGNFSAKTDANGNYSLVLIHGTYRIHEVVQSPLHPTTPGATGYPLTLGNGATVTGESFGNA